MNPFSHEKITNLVESAVWPDDIKGYKVGIMDPWHYLDVPVRLDDPSDPHTHILHKPNDSASLLVFIIKPENCYDRIDKMEQMGEE